ncbi:MAG: hypothetical protein AAB922_05800 [Patescibacteria group bacterium]
MSEQVAIRFRYADGEERTHVRTVEEWPLPDRLDSDGGWFQKVSESQLPPGLSPRVMRGAVYLWVPALAGEGT